MNLAQRLEAQLPRFPAALRAMFEAEIAAGNELRDVEVGRGPDEGKTAIILYRPFRAKHDPLTPGVTYRELLDRAGAYALMWALQQEEDQKHAADILEAPNAQGATVS